MDEFRAVEKLLIVHKCLTVVWLKSKKTNSQEHCFFPLKTELFENALKKKFLQRTSVFTEGDVDPVLISSIDLSSWWTYVIIPVCTAINHWMVPEFDWACCGTRADKISLRPRSLACVGKVWLEEVCQTNQRLRCFPRCWGRLLHNFVLFLQVKLLLYVVVGLHSIFHQF